MKYKTDFYVTKNNKTDFYVTKNNKTDFYVTKNNKMDFYVTTKGRIPSLGRVWAFYQSSAYRLSL